MLVTLFGFDPEDPHGPHRPENHTEDHWIYVSTHDTDTAAGWWAGAPADQREALERALRDRDIAEREGQEHWALIRLAFSSPCPVAMLAAQDVLGLGAESRMNVPGTKGSSWRWKLEPGQLGARDATRLREATREAGRLPR